MRNFWFCLNRKTLNLPDVVQSMLYFRISLVLMFVFLLWLHWLSKFPTEKALQRMISLLNQGPRDDHGWW